MELDAVNQAIFDEFHRITGTTNRFVFPVWYAAITRKAIANLHEHPGAAQAAWGRLTTPEQRDYLFRYLRAQAPACWPDLRLVVKRAHAATDPRMPLQALLEADCPVDEVDNCAPPSMGVP